MLKVPLPIAILMSAASAMVTAAVLALMRRQQDKLMLFDRENLCRMAECDCLTGLLNRTSARSRVEEYLHRPSAGPAALLLLDLDDFKDINDSCGHLIGDEALCGIAELLQKVFRASDVISRVGGDEFIVFMPSISSPEDAVTKANMIIHALAEKNRSGKQDESCCITCSIGVSLFPKHGRDYEKLFSAADVAMYCAKELGKNCCQIFESGVKI